MILIRWSAVAMTVCCAGLPAQQLLWRVTGIPDRSLIWDCQFLDDVDGDGYEDLVGEARLEPDRYLGIQVYSGRDGTPIRQLQSPPNRQFSGVRVIGDWDRDGTADYAYTIVSAMWPHDPPILDVRSGRDNRSLWSLQSSSYDEGITAAPGGELDLDGDGRVDLLVGLWHRTLVARRTLTAIDNSGQILYTVPIPNRLPGFGALGDVDADGCSDFGVWDGWNSVTVHAGKTGAPLYQVHGQRQEDYLGSGSILSCGDVDGDGADDFVLSSVAYRPIHGVVEVISGRSGTRIYTFRKEKVPFDGGHGFGEFCAGGRDIDQDGVPDLVVQNFQVSSTLGNRGGRASVFSLRDGTEIFDIHPDPSLGYNTWFGYPVALGAPHPGNPFPVIGVGEQNYFVPPDTGITGVEGRINLFRGLPENARPVGTPCRGTVGRAPRIGLTRYDAARTRLHLSNAPAGSPAILVVGVSTSSWHGHALPFALDVLGYTGCSLYTSIDLTVGVTTGTHGIDRGYAFVEVPSDADLNAQWFVLDPADNRFAVSGAMHW